MSARLVLYHSAGTVPWLNTFRETLKEREGIMPVAAGVKSPRAPSSLLAAAAGGCDAVAVSGRVGVGFDVLLDPGSALLCWALPA